MLHCRSVARPLSIVALLLAASTTSAASASAAAAAASLSSAAAAPNSDSDLVTSLPGWEGPLPSRWYSGYLDYTLGGGGGDSGGRRTVHTHYIYIEAQKTEEKPTPTSSDDDESASVGGKSSSEEESHNGATSTVRRARRTTRDSPDADSTASSSSDRDDAFDENDDDDRTPLIFWSNGGPGASSLFGLLTELGPLLLSDDSLKTEAYQRTGVPSLLPNPYSWSNLGSLLIFDAPAPVGYSYCDDDEGGDGLSCGGWDDDSSAENNYLALMAFYAKFPNLRRRPLYLTGESYAGIYVPRFAKRVLEGNAAAIGSAARNTNVDIGKEGDGDDGDDTDFLIPLRGFAVGDACTGTEVNCGHDAPWYHLEFIHGHGQISLKTHREVIAECGMETLMKPAKDPPPPGCAEAMKKVTTEMGGFYAYSLYDDCTYRNGILRKRRWRRNAATKKDPAATPNAAEADISAASLWSPLLDELDERAGGALNDYPCGGGPVMEKYVRIPSVKAALHIPPAAAFFSGDNGDGFNYTCTEPNLMPFYYDAAKGKYDEGNGGVHPRVLVYNGDTDPSINSFVAENWTSHVGLDETLGWTPWTIDGCRRMGGYVTRYQGNFDYLTIRGAGHMVPTYKPEASLAFLSSWIKNEPYPSFNPDCPHPSAGGGGARGETAAV